MFVTLAKGFSFLLATVVMVMMLVFGLLSLSSAGAGLRLAQKAADTQKAYYELDTRGENLLAACGDAAADAWNDAGAFAAKASAGAALPSDFDPSLKKAALSAFPNKPALRRGIFYYFLDKRLRSLKTGEKLSCAVDRQALAKVFLGNTGVSAETAASALTGRLNPRETLQVAFSFRFGPDGVPRAAPVRWQAAVSGLEVSSAQGISVWNGK